MNILMSNSLLDNYHFKVLNYNEKNIYLKLICVDVSFNYITKKFINDTFIVFCLHSNFAHNTLGTIYLISIKPQRFSSFSCNYFIAYNHKSITKQHLIDNTFAIYLPYKSCDIYTFLPVYNNNIEAYDLLINHFKDIILLMNEILIDDITYQILNIIINDIFK